MSCQWFSIFFELIIDRVNFKKRMGVVYFIFQKNVRIVLLIFVYVSLICKLLLKIFIVEIYLVFNGIPIILCLISIIWNICLKGLSERLICSIVRVGISNN